MNVIDALERARRLDAKLWGFGAEAHGYRLVTRLPKTDVDAACQAYGIDLPEAYRAHVETVGNGGAGPGYGLQRFGFLKTHRDVPRAVREGAMKTVVSTPHMTIKRPTYYDEAGQEIDAFDLAFWSSIERHAASGDPGPACLARPFTFVGPFDVEVDGEDDAPSFDDGSWPLCDYGCGMTARLVLNGTFAGQVWVSTLEGVIVPFAHMMELHYEDETLFGEPDRERTFDFAAWYEHWLTSRITEQARAGASQLDP
jgi:hypothetical protein